MIVFNVVNSLIASAVLISGAWVAIYTARRSKAVDIKAQETPLVGHLFNCLSERDQLKKEKEDLQKEKEDLQEQVRLMA